MKTKYSTLSRSRTYIVVPRDVPPENFLSVPETRKERRTGLVRCVLVPVLVLLVIVGLLSCLGWLVYDSIKPEEDSDSDSMMKDGYDSIATPCSSSPCQGGGQCLPHDGTFTCYCVAGRHGQLCEEEGRSDHAVAQFSQESFVRLRSVATGGPRTSIRLQFRPARRDTGVILHSSLESGQDTGNLSLALVQGHVQFRYHLGGAHHVLESPYLVSPGSWHSLVLQTYHGDAMLQLDRQDPVLGSLQGPGRFHGLGQQVVIGAGHGHVPGIRGCIKDLKFGHRAVSLVSRAEPLLLQSKGVGHCRRGGGG